MSHKDDIDPADVPDVEPCRETATLPKLSEGGYLPRVPEGREPTMVQLHKGDYIIPGWLMERLRVDLLKEIAKQDNP